jgi:DNA-binding response OmpR family regulator
METNLIDVYVRRLRQKFESVFATTATPTTAAPLPLIKTLRGTGYLMQK